MNNVLQANGLTMISDMDYGTFKHWQAVFNVEFKHINIGEDLSSLKFMEPEGVYKLGASHMLDDVLAMFEAPGVETVAAFKELTAPSLNGWQLVGLTVVAVSGMWGMAKMLERMDRKDARRFTWTSVI